MSLKMHSAYRSNQGEIWEDIREKAESLRVRAETEAMHDIYESYDRDLKAYEESFKPHPGQVGFIAAIDDKIIGCDIFGPKSVIPKVFDKLLRGYILDALDRAPMGDKASPPRKPLTPEEAEKFLKKLARCRKEEFKSVGEGNDVRLGSRSLNGFALVNSGEVVHVAAFAE